MSSALGISVWRKVVARLPFLASLTAAATLTVSCFAEAAEPRRSPAEWLAQIGRQWDEAAWAPKPPARPAAYLRPLDDVGWQSRWRARQALAAAGSDASEALLKALRAPDAPTRILAAESLGYLGAKIPRDALLDAATQDADAAVRLYAIDSLGMSGQAGSLAAELENLAKTEKNRDVKLHLGYALDRKGERLSADAIRKLVKWNADQIDSAKLNQPAPDFELASLDGKTLRLSQFRGQKAVVLVFIYGDT